MKKTLFLTGIYYAVALIIFLSSFKYFRTFFPPTEITNYKIVGYSQYFGYPFYYDTIIFCLLVLAPSVIFLVLYLIRKK